MWLLVGGSGFIGTNFAKFLEKKKLDFRIYDQKKSKYLPKNIPTIIGDIRDKDKLSKAMEDCETIFHLATIPPSLRLSPREIYDIDVEGTRNIIEAAESNNVKKIIFTSSASHVYGIVKKEICPIREDHKLNPINEYGRNKIIAEELLKDASKSKKIKTIILRLSMVMGPYNFDPVFSENVKSLLKSKRVYIAGNGEALAQSIHVKDVNSVLFRCGNLANNSISEYTELNISGEEILSIKEWVHLLRSITNSESKVTHLPFLIATFMNKITWLMQRSNVHPSYLKLMAHDQYFDIDKAKNLLIWEPRLKIKKALIDAVEFLRGESKN